MNDTERGGAMRDLAGESGTEALARFAVELIDMVFDGDDLDSFDIQEEARKAGLLEPYTVTDPTEAEDYDCEVGDTCFRYAPHVLVARRALLLAPTTPNSAGQE